MKLLLAIIETSKYNYYTNDLRNIEILGFNADKNTQHYCIQRWSQNQNYS